jgi:Protein of unknown function (DUF2599)
MLRPMAAVAAVSVALLISAPARADESPTGPPYIDHTEWVHWADLSSLRVYPTPSGRAAAGQLGTGAEADEAWTEVLADSPDADTSGMREQFLCHWQLAEFAEPGKTSWNLEPWRPEVDAAAMIEAGCNPGGIEEPF